MVSGPDAPTSSGPFARGTVTAIAPIIPNSPLLVATELRHQAPFIQQEQRRFSPPCDFRSWPRPSAVHPRLDDFTQLLPRFRLMLPEAALLSSGACSCHREDRSQCSQRYRWHSRAWPG